MVAICPFWQLAIREESVYSDLRSSNELLSNFILYRIYCAHDQAVSQTFESFRLINCIFFYSNQSLSHCEMNDTYTQLTIATHLGKRKKRRQRFNEEIKWKNNNNDNNKHSLSPVLCVM